MRNRYSFTSAGDDNQSDDGEVLRRQCRQIGAGVERRVAAMWCKSCRQEVPGVVDPLDGRYGCPRCGAILLTDVGLDLSELSMLPQASLEELVAAAEAAPAASEIAARTHSVSSKDLPEFEPVRTPRTEPSRVTTLRWDAANWELNEKLRHVERVTVSSRRRGDAPAAAAPLPLGRSAWPTPPMPVAVPAAPAIVPTAQALPYSAAGFAVTAPPVPPSPYNFPVVAYAAPSHPSSPFAPAPASAPSHSADESYVDEYDEVVEPVVSHGTRVLASVISWLFLGGAATAFSCGGFLAGWGAVVERADLQQLGMPIVMLGIVALVIGVLPQLFLQRQAERRSASPSHGAVPSRGPVARHYGSEPRGVRRATAYRNG